MSLTILLLVVLLFCKAFYKYRVAMGKLEFYRDQKIEIYPGADRFIFGNLFDTLAYQTAQKALDEPIINGTGWLLEKLVLQKNGEKDEAEEPKIVRNSKFDAKDHPVVMIVNTGVVCMIVQDPEVVQDLFVK